MRYLIMLALLLSSCVNPTKMIQDKTDDFRKNYKDNIIIYSVDSRPMSLAWSGDPQNPPLLFVHGSPGSHEAWSEFLVNKELQKKYHLLAVDRPGYGGSQKGGVELSVQKQAADIVKALEFNHSGKKAILIGHSYGGPVIARIAMDHPEKVAGLIFVAGALDPEFESVKWYQYPATWSFFRWILPNNLTVCNDEVMALRKELEDMLPMWSRITAASIILQGDDDELVDPKNLQFLEQKLAHSQILKATLVPGLNHFVPWKRPDLIFDGIESMKSFQ